MKLLLPWKEIRTANDSLKFVRFSLDGRWMYYIFQNINGEWCGFTNERHYSAENAMITMDNFLIKKGWKLIAEGKEDVYKCLI